MIPGRPLAEPDRVPDAAAGTAEPLVADEPSPAADAEAPPEGSDEAAPAATARRRRLTLVLVAVLVVIAVVATTLAGVFYGRYRDDRAQRREVVNVSSAMVTALTTYDYTNLDASRKQVLALATGRFKQEYDKGSEPLRLVLTQTQAKSTGTVRKVYVGDVADGSAETIVIADQVVTGVSGSRPVAGQQLSLTLVRVNGHWRVDGLALDATASPDTVTPPASTTTTSP